MRASSKLLISIFAAVIAVSLVMDAAFAQSTLPGLTTATSGKLAPLQRVFKIFADPWVMAFGIFCGFWALFYFSYRLGLEKSGQVPATYVHKLAMVLSFLSMAPMLWWIATAVDAKAATKTLLFTYIGPTAVGLVGVIILSMGYWSARHVFRPAGP